MRKLSILCAALAVVVSAGGAYGHCEIPCGIYGDDQRFSSLDEDIRTVEKSMTKITELSADPATNANMIARWVMNKEHHADRIRETVTQYFMTQRIKLPDESDAAAVTEYRDQLALLHKMLVYAMKSKQSTDPANTSVLHETLHAFQKAYEK